MYNKLNLVWVRALFAHKQRAGGRSAIAFSLAQAEIVWEIAIEDDDFSPKKPHRLYGATAEGAKSGGGRDG